MGSATVNLPFTFGIGDQVPSDIPPEVRGAFIELYAAVQQVQYVFHAYAGIGQQLSSLWSSLPPTETLHRASVWRLYVKASEAISYGHAISIHSVASVLNVRKANATNNTKPCHGFCTTSTGIASGSYGEVILCQGLLTSLAGLTQGTRYFLSTTDGLLTATAPVAAGNIEQPLGLALDATLLLFNFAFGFIQH